MTEINENLRTCPTADFTCPYFNLQYCACTMFEEEGTEPAEECDDYMAYCTEQALKKER